MYSGQKIPRFVHATVVLAGVALASLLLLQDVQSQDVNVGGNRWQGNGSDAAGVVRIPSLTNNSAFVTNRPTAKTANTRSVITAPQHLQLAALEDEGGLSSQPSPAVPVPHLPAPTLPQRLKLQRNAAAVEVRRQAIVPQTQRQMSSSESRPSSRYVLRETSAEEELQLQIGLPHILTLRQPPLRTYIPESGAGIVAVRYIDPAAPHRLAIEPLATGTTMLTMWFGSDTSPDGEEPVSWLVHVTDASGADGPASLARNRGYEIQLQALQREVNYAFPNSSVQLSWVGSQVLLRGKAKDIEEATQIARIVSSSIPGSRRNGENDFLEQAEFLAIDADLIQEAGSLLGSLRGDSSSGINQGRINNQVINLLEIAGVHQVMLKVTVAEVNRSASRAIGADLKIGSASDAVRFFTTLGTPAAGGALVLDQSDFDLAISTLKRLNLARSLAEPTLTTLNGQPASFNVGGSFPVPVVTGQTATGLQGVEFQNFGVQLQFVPVVTDGNRVRLTLQASVSTRDETAGAQVGNTNVPGLNTRNFSNTVELREGQTLAVAGLIQTNLGGTSARVPFLGDVPVLGRLFSNDGTSYDEQELVVLVTPYLVGPVDTKQQPLALPGSDYFEPDDVEFFVRGSLAGHTAEDYRSPVRTDLRKMKAFRRCEQRVIIGQPGHSNGLLCPPVSVPASAEAVPSNFVPPSSAFPASEPAFNEPGVSTLQPFEFSGENP